MLKQIWDGLEGVGGMGWIGIQGRIQDLSEGGQEIFRNKKMNNKEQKIVPQAKFFLT